MNQIEWTFELRFAVAIALGFLVGLERESTKIEQQKLVFGGVRTHPIISIYGFACAWLYKIGATIMLPVGLGSMIVLTGIAYYAKIRGERYGSTTEISTLLTFVVGALALMADIWISMALAIVNTMLLSEKARLETYVEKLNRVDFLATLKFLLVTVIVLPVLPDQEYTQFKLNPASIWKMVILVSTLGFIGYALAKRFGHTLGLAVSGLLGGVVSSTAVTIAAGRMAQKEPDRARSALRSSILAASVMYLRILALVAIVNSALVPALAWKCAVLAVVGFVLSLTIRGEEKDSSELPVTAVQNPFEISPALLFAVLFVALSIVTILVRQWAGPTGILGLSAIVGITDIDPFILSLVQSSDSVTTLSVAAILIAMMSNTLAKGLYFGVLVPGARKQTAWRYITWALLHIPLVLAV